jgi:hypothetical protein
VLLQVRYRSVRQPIGGERACQQRFDGLDLVGVFVSGFQRVSLVRCGIAETNFLHVAGQRSRRCKREFRGSPHPIHRRPQLRQFREFAAVRRNQQRVIRLQRAAQVAKRSEFVGRIEKQEAPEHGMLHHSDQRWIDNSFRQFDRQNDVIEAAHVRRHFRSDRATFGIDHHVVGIDADALQHRAHQCGFVFTVAVAVRKYLDRGMRLVASNPQLDTHIANIVL